MTDPRRKEVDADERRYWITPDESHPTCSIHDCSNQQYCRGWCIKHYTRWRKHGSPEPKAKRHEAGSTFLRLILLETDECVEWPFSTYAGYPQVRVSDKTYRGHALALTLRVGPMPAPGLVAAHGPCHNPICINYRHLAWATHAQNAADKLRDNTHHRGERNPGAKLTEADVLAIRESGDRYSDIASRHGVSKSLIKHIRNGRRWSWLLSGEGDARGAAANEDSRRDKR